MYFKDLNIVAIRRSLEDPVASDELTEGQSGSGNQSRVPSFTIRG